MDESKKIYIRRVIYKNVYMKIWQISIYNMILGGFFFLFPKFPMVLIFAKIMKLVLMSPEC